MAEKKLNLLADFPAITTEEWMAKINADLKGADFEKKLVWKTNEGFNVMPFYRLEDVAELKTTTSAPGEFPYVRGTKTDNDWYVRQDIDATCAKTANAKALDVLNKGINSLGFILNKKELSAEYIATLLEGICAECDSFSVRAHYHEQQALAAEICEKQECTDSGWLRFR